MFKFSTYVTEVLPPHSPDQCVCVCGGGGQADFPLFTSISIKYIS